MTMELAFEFSIEDEKEIHNSNILTHARLKQKIAFRPGVNAKGLAIDIITQERTLKKLRQMYRVLEMEYNIPSLLIKEALLYTNNVEDALQYLVFQYTSEELPSTLRANVHRIKAIEKAVKNDTLNIKLDCTISAKSQDKEMKEKEQDLLTDSMNSLNISVNKIKPLRKKSDEVDSQVKQSAVSWTEQFLLMESQREGEEYELKHMQAQDEKATITMGRTALERKKNMLEQNYIQLSDSLKQKESTNGKLSKKQEKCVRLEIQAIKAELLALGWSEAEFFISRSQNQKVDVKKKNINAVENVHNDKDIEDTDEDDAFPSGFFSENSDTEINKDDKSFTSASQQLESTRTTVTIYEAESRQEVRTMSKANKSKKKNAGSTSWTGKTPRMHLEEWCRKNGTKPPQYKKAIMPTRKGYLYSISLKGYNDFKLPESEHFYLENGFPSIDEAKEAIATATLYELNHERPMYLLFPPIYRNMWCKWMKEKETYNLALNDAEKADKEGLLKRLVKSIPDELKSKMHSPNANEPKEPPSEPTKSLLESWDMDAWDAEDKVDEVNDSIAKITENVSSYLKLDANHLSETLKTQMEKYKKTKLYKKHFNARSSLPIANFKDQILALTERHNIVLISGETGCGKSTQVPQFILENMLVHKANGARTNIIVTQPRRLAALSLAERVNVELGESNSVGVKNSLVGSQIRLESQTSPSTRLLFCTTGILLRKLENPAALTSEISHIIVDEVHERDLQTDVLLSILKFHLAESQVARNNSSAKIILMSATLDTEKIQSYFGGSVVCPVLKVPGRTFPVESYYLEDVIEHTEFKMDDSMPNYIDPLVEINSKQNKETAKLKISGRGGSTFSTNISWSRSSPQYQTQYAEEHENYSRPTIDSLECMDFTIINYDLIQTLLEYIMSSNQISFANSTNSASILIFLPGLAEISSLLDLLSCHREFGDLNRFALLPLHSSLSSEDQQQIFNANPNIVRIIASTNIAETSLTIDDVQIVIDTGRVKEMTHHFSSRTNVLEEIWISKANAKQRTGRAGRTSRGKCYRLFPKHIYKHKMLDQPIPEICRAPLASICLQIKTWKALENTPTCLGFFQQCLDPPDFHNVNDALDELIEIGAFISRENEDLTALGSHLSVLPVDVKVGKLLILGAIFNCFDEISTCAAILESKSPFVAPFGYMKQMENSRKSFSVFQSDLLTDANAYYSWQRALSGPNSLTTLKTHGNNYERGIAYCRKHFLNHRSLFEISKLKSQFNSIIRRQGLLPNTEATSDNVCTWTVKKLGLISGLIYASFSPNIVHVDKRTKRGDLTLTERNKLKDMQVLVHPSSVNFKLSEKNLSSFLTYFGKTQTSQVYINVSNIVLPSALAMFSQQTEVLLTPNMNSESPGNSSTIEVMVKLNELVKLQSSYRSGMILKQINMLLQEMVQVLLEKPLSANKKNSGTSVDEVWTDKNVMCLVDIVSNILEKDVEIRDPNNLLTRNLVSPSISK